MAGYSPPPLPEAPPTHFLTLSDGRNLAYVDFQVEPPRTEKAVVLFFHGGPGSRMLAQIFHESAKNADVRLVSFDRAGYGRSTPHPSPTFSQSAHDAEALLQHLGVTSAVLMGMSAGGPPAAAAASHLGPRVARGLVLVSAVAPAYELGGLFKAFEGTIAANAYIFPFLASLPVSAGSFLIGMLPPITLDEKTVKNLPEADRRVLLGENLRLVNEDIEEAFVGGEQGPAMTWKTYLSDFRNFSDAEAWGGFKAQEMTVPTLVVHGDADMNVPFKHAEFWSQSMGNSELFVSKGEGHFNALKLGQEGDFCPEMYEKAAMWCSQ